MTAINDLLAALPDPLTEIELTRRLAREAYERGREDGWYQGHEAAEQEMAQRWERSPPRSRAVGIEQGELEERRWGPAGRERFGEPRSGDRTPVEMIARAFASWEPFGLPEPGMVHLSGPVVHWHRPCAEACYAYRPGWYAIAESASTILRTLPGDYAGQHRRAESAKPAAWNGGEPREQHPLRMPRRVDRRGGALCNDCGTEGPRYREALARMPVRRRRSRRVAQCTASRGGGRRAVPRREGHHGGRRPARCRRG